MVVCSYLSIDLKKYIENFQIIAKIIQIRKCTFGSHEHIITIMITYFRKICHFLRRIVLGVLFWHEFARLN